MAEAWTRLSFGKEQLCMHRSRLSVSLPSPNQRNGRPPASDRIGEVSFWRQQVIDFALDRETQTHIGEQRAWILREPSNPNPYYQLAQLFRLAFKPDEALGLLLEA